MFSQRQGYYSKLIRSYPILKFVDIYDRQSFIREYVLDNIFVCTFVYFLFYVALWYANKIIKRIERTNREMLAAVEENRLKLDDVVALKNKRAEYEEVVIKAKGAQRTTTKHLENEIKRLSTEFISTANKLSELEKLLGKCKFRDSPFNTGTTREGESPEGLEDTTNAFEDLKVLEPSFPPPLPPEPPPRKYGIFVTRPPGQRPAPLAFPSAPTTPPPKIGFK